MGKILSVALRPMKRFNIENRAHRVISKEKPEPAPHYPSNITDIQRALEYDPKLTEKLSTKNLELDNRLRDVYVMSEGPAADDRSSSRYNPDRPLPLERGPPVDFEYGIKPPEKIPYGKLTLKTVMEFLSHHQVSPEDVTYKTIARDYKIKEEDAKDILRYFRTFEMYIPKAAAIKGQFAGPSKVQYLKDREIVKEIGDNNTGGNKT